MYNNSDVNLSYFLRNYNDSTRPQFNSKIFERNDENIIKYLEDVILSCQREKYFTLKVLEFNVITDYADIQKILWTHEENRKKKKDINPYDNISLNDSDIMILQVKYFIKLNMILPNSKEPSERELEVLISLPRYVEKYYFKLSGNYYSTIFQVVDASTYNNYGSQKIQVNTEKLLFSSLRIYKRVTKLICIDGEPIDNITIYSVFLFTKSTPAIKYLLARYGLYGTLEYLGIQDVIFIATEFDNTEEYYIFKEQNILIATPKEIFKFDKIVQSFIATVILSILPETPFAAIFDIKYWIRCLGGEFGKYTDEKGISILNSFETLYDIITKNTLHLPMQDKCDIYAILRWHMREFSAIRMKDNLDARTKRIRLEEYIAAYYAFKLFSGLCRISNNGKNITIKQIVSAIYTTPMYLIRRLLMDCKMISCSDLVNENDAILASSYTLKGISGLGDQKDKPNAISPIYRMIHPSHLFIYDLESSTNSDPGLSGVLSPFAQINDDGTFVNFEEPNSWESAFNDFLNNYRQTKNKFEVVTFKNKSGLFMYDTLIEDILKETLTSYNKLICPIHDVNGLIDYSLSHSMGRRVKIQSVNVLDFEIPDYIKEDEY